MKNSDHLTDQEIEETLAALMSECDETLARGLDPTSLLEQIGGLPPEIRREFAEAVETLKDIQEVLTKSKNSQENLRPFGKFRLLRILGQGSFGVVWLAEDTALGRKVALKIPHLHRQLSPEAANRFIREARAAAALEHPHLVPLLEIGQVDGLDYLASVYCEGPTLAEWMQNRPAPVSFEQIARFVEKLAQAGAHMHERGIVHRDLKPSNVLLFPATHSTHGKQQSLDDSVPRITDFGLARRHEISETLTRTGIILGTPVYMAPEQAWGRPSDVGPAADIYALGVILYELIDGHPPFHAENELELLRAKENEPVSLRRRNRAVPRDLDTICLKCLNPEPAKRYGTMTELAGDLGRFLDGRPISARQSGFIERTACRVRRNPRFSAVSLVSVMLMLGLAGTIWWFGMRENGLLKSIANEKQAAENREKRAAENREKREFRNQAYAAKIREAGRVHERKNFEQLNQLLLPFQAKDGEDDVRGFEWHYLWGYAPRDFLDWKHARRIRETTYSSDGRLCLSSGDDNVIRIFDPTDGTLRTTLEGHTLPVVCVAFLADDKELVSAGVDNKGAGDFVGELIHWDLARERPIRSPLKYRGNSREQRRVDPLPRVPTFAVAREARKVFIADHSEDVSRILEVDLKTGNETEIFRNASPKTHLGFVVTTPSAGLIAYNINQVNVIVMNLSQKKTVVQQRFDLGVHGACFSDDGNTLALAHGLPGYHPDQRIEICEAQSLRKKQTTSMPEACIGLSFDPPGERLAAIGNLAGRLPYAVRVWDVGTGRPFDSSTYRGSEYEAYAFSPSGNQMAFGGADGHVRIRAFADRISHTLAGPLPKSEAWSVVFSKDGDELWTGYDHEEGGDRETLRRWDWKKKRSRSLDGHLSTVSALTLRPDGKQVASASFDGTIRFWEPATKEPRKVLKGHQSPVRAVAYRPDGRHLASGGSDHIVRIWSVADGKSVKSLQGHSAKVRCLAYSADGKMLITAGNDKSVKIWDAESYEMIREIQEFDNVQALSCSPNEPLVATGNEKGEVNLWNLKTATLVRSMSENGGKVRAVAFSPDGRTIAFGGEGKTVRLRQTATGQDLLTLPCDAFVNGLAFDPRNRTLAAALHDGTVKVWTAD